jgi:hypothetical protein
VRRHPRWLAQMNCFFGAGDGVVVRNNGRRRRTGQISANRARREKGRRREEHGGKLRALYCTSNGRLKLSRLRQMLRKVREGASVMPLSENPILLYAMSLAPRSNHASGTDYLLSPRWTNLQSYCMVGLYFLNEATFFHGCRVELYDPVYVEGQCTCTYFPQLVTHHIFLHLRIIQRKNGSGIKLSARLADNSQTFCRWRRLDWISRDH